MTLEQLITDNGTAYTAKAHAIGCRVLGIRRIRTRPRRPQRTNGKAERFIRTMLAGWAYGAIYSSSQDRTAALDRWLCSPHRANQLPRDLHLPEQRSPRGKQHVGRRGKDPFEPAAVRPDRVHLEPAVEAEEAQEQDAPSGR